MAYPDEIREAARGLYLKRWTPQEIKDELGLNSCRVVYFWAEKYGWRDLLTEEAVEDAINRRLLSLLGREKKTAAELDEIDRLVGHHVSLKEKALKWAERKHALTARSDAEDEPASERPRRSRGGQDGGPRKGKGGKKAKNEIGHLTPEDFAE
ncbi:MAG: terminase gpP N-terminus-related DNA-binding protein, partial [Aeromonas veronii]